MARLTRVNALSGLHLISTVIQALERQVSELCQCPLGLIPHFYMYLHVGQLLSWMRCVNALSGLYLISTLQNSQME